MNETPTQPAAEYATDIAATAARHGVDLSADQLRHLRDEGAVTYLGTVSAPGGGRGRAGLYAAGTAMQVVEIRRRMMGDDLAGAMWRMWLDGFDVAEKWTRAPILDAARKWDRRSEEVRRRAFISSGEAFSDKLLEALEEPSRFRGGMALVRKLVGLHRFDTFLFRIVGLALGREIPTTNQSGHTDDDLKYEEKALVEGLGFDRLTKNRIGAVPAISSGGIIAVLNKNARRLRGKILADEIEKLPVSHLRDVALEIAAIKKNNRRLFKSLKWLYGIHALGRGHAARLFDRYSFDDELNLIVLWAVNRVDFVPGINREFSPENTEALELIEEEFAAFGEILTANPAFAQIVTPEIIRRLFATSKNKAEFIGEIQHLVFSRLLGLIRYRSQTLDR